MKPPTKIVSKASFAEICFIVALLVIAGIVALDATNVSPSEALDDAPREAVHGTNMDDSS